MRIVPEEQRRIDFKAAIEYPCRGKEGTWRDGNILLRPSYVKHFQVILDDADLLLLMSLIEVLQDDGDVHVDDYHIADDDERGEVRDRQQGVSAISVHLSAVRSGIALGWLHHQRLQHVVPAGRGHQTEQQLHTSTEGFEIHLAGGKISTLTSRHISMRTYAKRSSGKNPW